MKKSFDHSPSPISQPQLAPDASAADCVAWYFDDFLPAWAERTRIPNCIGFADALDANGRPNQENRRTVLAQARLLYTFAHLALKSENLVYYNAAHVARDALEYFRRSPGLYCHAVTKTGLSTGDPNETYATSYDQSFVILGLSTWGQLHPDEDVSAELEACWSAIETNLRDPVTGLVLEHDGVTDPTAENAPNRAQNPHMHLYCLLYTSDAADE